MTTDIATERYLRGRKLERAMLMAGLPPMLSIVVAIVAKKCGDRAALAYIEDMRWDREHRKEREESK